MSNGIRYGIIGGLLWSIAYLLAYLFNTKMMFNPVLQYGSLLFPIASIVLCGLAEKKENPEVLPFKSVLKETFIAAVIAPFIMIFFYFLLSTVIDPSIIEVQKQVAIEAIEKYSEYFNDDQYEEMIERIDGQNYSSLPYTLLRWFLNIIFGFLVCVIISLIVRKEEAF
jgi:phosphate/sulfate permease